MTRGTPVRGDHAQGDPPDPSEEERALRALEWQVVLSRFEAQRDRRRRVLAAQDQLAELKLAQRRQAEDTRRLAARAAARERFASGEPLRPNDRHVDLDVVREQLDAFRIEQL